MYLCVRACAHVIETDAEGQRGHSRVQRLQKWVDRNVNGVWVRQGTQTSAESDD